MLSLKRHHVASPAFACSTTSDNEMSKAHFFLPKNLCSYSYSSRFAFLCNQLLRVKSLQLLRKDYREQVQNLIDSAVTRSTEVL